MHWSPIETCRSQSSSVSPYRISAPARGLASARPLCQREEQDATRVLSCRTRWTGCEGSPAPAWYWTWWWISIGVAMNMHGSQSTASFRTPTCWESDPAPLLYLLVKLVSSRQFCVALRRAHTLNYVCILRFVLRFTVMFPPKFCGKASNVESKPCP